MSLWSLKLASNYSLMCRQKYAVHKLYSNKNVCSLKSGFRGLIKDEVFQNFENWSTRTPTINAFLLTLRGKKETHFHSFAMNQFCMSKIFWGHFAFYHLCYYIQMYRRESLKPIPQTLKTSILKSFSRKFLFLCRSKYSGCNSVIHNIDTSYKVMIHVSQFHNYFQ